MQSRIKFSILIPVIALLIFTSCSKTNKEGRNIPADAVFVMHLNGESLNSKLPWEELKQNILFQEAYGDSTNTALIRSIMDNPENSGIDVKNDLLVFYVKDTTGSYIAAQGSIKDEAKFKAFNNNINKTAPVASEKDGIRFLSSENMTASWNKEKFVIVSDITGKTDFKNTYEPDTFSINTPDVKRDLNALAAQIFNLKEDKSLGKDEKFTELIKTKADMHFWLNIEAMGVGNTDMPGMAALSMINFKKILEGSRLAATVNFENGKISADFISYSGKEMTELVKKYSGDKINNDMVKRLPTGNLAALIALNFKPEGIREYLKLLGMDGFVNMGSAFLGFNLDDFVKANKGDILLAVTDVKEDSIGRPDASILFSTTIGDKAAFGKLIDAGKKFGKDKLNGENGPQIAFNTNDNYFAIGNKKQDVDKFFTTNQTSIPAFLDKISGSSSVVYINFQYILKAMSADAKRDSLEKIIYDASLNMWDNFLANSNGFKNGGSAQHIEVNLLDKNTNSLKKLNSYLGTLAMVKKKQDERNKISFMNENTDDAASIAPESY